MPQPRRSGHKAGTFPQPECVVSMPKAVDIPANGDVQYTYEIVPPDFPRIAGFRCRRCVHRAGPMCTMRWSTSVHLTLIG